MTYMEFVGSLERKLRTVWSEERAGKVVLQALKNLDEATFVEVLRTMPPLHFKEFVGFVGDDLEFLLTDFLITQVFEVE